MKWKVVSTKPIEIVDAYGGFYGKRRWLKLDGVTSVAGVCLCDIPALDQRYGIFGMGTSTDKAIAIIAIRPELTVDDFEWVQSN